MNIGLHPSTPFGLASLEHGPFGFCMPLMMLYVYCSLMKALRIFFFKYVLFTSSKMCFVWRAIDECSTLQRTSLSLFRRLQLFTGLRGDDPPMNGGGMYDVGKIAQICNMKN